MKCPRCHIDVPSEAVRCPDCKLPKPKSLIAQSKDSKGKTSSLSGKASPFGKKPLYPTGKRGQKPEKKLPKWVSITCAAVSFVLIASIGVYAYWHFAHSVSELDPQLAPVAMRKLQNMPSPQAGRTVDQYMKDLENKSRKDGNLVAAQGWTMHPVQGTSSKMLITFSFQEKDNTEQRAEWLADLSGDTFTPQTELAASAVRH
jgi:hypothetical protein